MLQEEVLESYPLFVALTRPAMVFGVTQTFFVLSFTPCIILFMISKNLIIAGLLYISLHLFGIICCWKDPFTFDVLLGKFDLICFNRQYWGCNSYDPH